MKLSCKQSDPYDEWFDQERGLEVFEADDDVDEVETDEYNDRDLL